MTTTSVTKTKRKRGTVSEELSARRQQLRDEHSVAVRERIQTTKLVENLQAFALGVPGQNGKKVKLTGAQLKATEMLLDKSVPDLASIKHEVERKQVVFLFGNFEDDTKKVEE